MNKIEIYSVIGCVLVLVVLLIVVG